MKHALALIFIVLVSLGALFLAQRRPAQEAVSPNAVVDVVADWQRDLSRAPMQLTRISDNEETRIGDQLAARYESIQPIQDAEAEALQRYVRQVGGRVASHAKRKLAYRFHLIPNASFVNAFALPGGHVFIGRGLLDLLTSEDELAFVLGHEIEHIDHYHAVERVQTEAKLRHLDLGVVAAIAQIPIALWQAGYSKDQEFEADREGLRAAVATGYSPQGAIKFLEQFVKLHREYVIRAKTPTGEASQVVLRGLAGYFRSHPFFSERLALAKQIIAHDHMPLDQRLKPFQCHNKRSSVSVRVNPSTRSMPTPVPG